jgi:hypothetical protein
MRRLTIFLALGLAACIPGSRPPQPQVQPRPGPPAQPSPQATLQCHLDLAREQARFRALPDRRFENGCSAIGSVQLTDIGTPTTNLGAMTCPLALRYTRWMREVVQPAARQIFDAPVTRVETFGTYSCRPVNGQPGARLSEHGFSNAIDISGFVIGQGRRVMVVDGWNGQDDRARRFLRAVHQGGCRLFSVGLGPDANALHYNHLHFDMGRGPYCR